MRNNYEKCPETHCKECWRSYAWNGFPPRCLDKACPCHTHNGSSTKTHTKKDCGGTHCKCMGGDCANYHYADHIAEINEKYDPSQVAPMGWVKHFYDAFGDVMHWDETGAAEDIKSFITNLLTSEIAKA